MPSSHRARPVRLALALALGALVLAPLAAPAQQGPAPAALAWSNENAPGGGGVWGLGGGPGALVLSGMGDLGTWRSADDGRTWTEIADFPAIVEARVAWSPAAPLEGYVHGFGGIARTADGGVTWDLVMSTPAAYRGDVDATGRAAMTWRDDAFRTHVSVTDDGGATWTEWHPPLPNFTSPYGLAFGRTASELLVMDMGNVWVTHDAGATWARTGPGGLDLAVEADGDAWRAGLGEVARSADGGDTWQAVTVPANAQTLAARPAGGVFMSTSQGFYVTKDDGATWTAMGHEDIAFGATTMMADPEDGEAVLVSSEFFGVVWIGPDGNGGYRAEVRTSGLPPIPVAAVAASADGGLVMANHDNLGVFVSRDGGLTWGHTGVGMGGSRMPALAVSGDGAVAYAGGRNLIFQPVFAASRDGGRTWTGGAFDAGGDGTVKAFAIDPADARHAFAAVPMDLAPSRVFETRDGGLTWASLPTFQGRLEGIAWHAPTRTLLAATGMGLLAYEPGPLGGAPAWQPRPTGAAAPWVASAGGAAFAPGAGALDLWRTPLADRTVVAPWADLPMFAARVALDPSASTLWAMTMPGQLHRCATTPLKPACENVTPPASAVAGVAFAGDGSRAWAASDEGLWTTALP